MPNSYSEYEEYCPNEEQSYQEKTPNIADINILTKKFKHETKKYLDLEKEDPEVLQSKTESLPKGLVPLEELFYFNDVAKKPKLEPVETEIEECNIGSELKPKMIKLSKNLPAHIKLKCIEMFKSFSDVFSWSYGDLKSYDTEII